jgi:hypothetical protein
MLFCSLFVRLHAAPRLFSDSTVGRKHVPHFARGRTADKKLFFCSAFRKVRGMVKVTGLEKALLRVGVQLP